jgi:hypothetical protein
MVAKPPNNNSKSSDRPQQVTKWTALAVHFSMHVSYDCGTDT